MGNALWAWALAFTFFMSFEGSSYWFIYPNRGRIFLRENSNGLKVLHLFDEVAVNLLDQDDQGTKYRQF